MRYISVLFLLTISQSIFAIDEDSKKEILERCKAQMSEYGASMVKSCVDQDLTAWEKVASFRNSHQEISSRCLQQMQKYGYSMVESCITQDIAVSYTHLTLPTKA